MHTEKIVTMVVSSNTPPERASISHESDLPSPARTVLSFQEGLTTLTRSISELLGKSTGLILVGVYGLPGSGKSFLIEKTKQCIERSGTSVAGYTGAPNTWVFTQLRDRPDHCRRVQLFHYGELMLPQGHSKLSCSFDDEPATLAQCILSRPLDVTVGLYNATNFSYFYSTSHHYDIVINNSMS
jgi:hypothetical protein